MRDPAARAGAVKAAEAWFLRHGLPYFVDDVRATVRRRASPGLVATVVALGLTVGAVVGVTAGLIAGQVSLGLAAGATAFGVVFAGYTLQALKADVISVWALRRAFDSLGLLLPLATRALPMLLLFVTFLFINAEVWQVASSLEGGVLWGAVLFFAAAAVGFLIPRLSEELDRFDNQISRDDIVEATRGTRLEAVADETVDGDVDLPDEAQVTGLQMINLIGVLVVAQAVQVLLLSLAVFAFFMVFGVVAIDEAVIESWIGTEPEPLLGLGFVSVELLRVSVFLAAFSGLYFAVVAITDDLYRKEFFTEIMDELARAVAVRVVYRELRRTTVDPDSD